MAWHWLLQGTTPRGAADFERRRAMLERALAASAEMGEPATEGFGTAYISPLAAAAPTRADLGTARWMPDHDRAVVPPPRGFQPGGDLGERLDPNPGTRLVPGRMLRTSGHQHPLGGRLVAPQKGSAMQLRRAGAEAFGTFVLVFGGVGAAVIAGETIGALGIALAFGLSLLAMAYAIGPISGCHINPAVTLGLLASRRIEWREAATYWIAQLAGALLAAAVLAVIVEARSGAYDFAQEGFGANGYGSQSPDGYPVGAVLLVEVILTAILVFTVLAATDKLASVAFAGIPIGLVLTLIHLVGIPVDNTSVNPARSFGPAVFVGDWALEQLWLFILAPLLGGLLGSVLHGALFAGAKPVRPDESAVAAADARAD